MSDQITTEKLKYKNVSQPKDNLKNSDVPIIESFHLQNQVKSYLSLSSNINDGDCNAGDIVSLKFTEAHTYDLIGEIVEQGN